ncbi:MAG: NAD(P)/FAD-dependent oxidoreductase [Burkholderiaceae bacterium]
MSAQRSVAVVGAGLSGLACAAAVEAGGWTVRVFDKSRGPSGRMSTRRGQGWQCDHGAQYFTARDPDFRAVVARWQQAGVAALWIPRIASWDGTQWRSPSTALDRFVGTPRMTAPAGWLAQQLAHPVQTSTTVRALSRDGDRWALDTLEHGRLAERFDHVVLAMPAPQAKVLCAPVAPALAALAESARMRGCWALMLQYGSPLALPVDAAFVNAGPLRWVARDSAKPGRTGAETWLLHANPEWSEAHIEDAPEAAAAALIEAFTALGAPAPDKWTAHRWRYADTEVPLECGHGWDATSGLGVCGDWLAGGKVEGAWRSGCSLASALLAAAGSST